MNYSDLLTVSEGLVAGKLSEIEVYTGIMNQISSLNKRNLSTGIKKENLFKKVHV
jgi:hypothetical protein